MKIKLGFYIMTLKGYIALKNFIERYGSDAVAYVVSSKDKKLKKDYYNEIIEICSSNKIKFFNKSEKFSEFADYNIAISWKWMINDCNKLIVLHDSLLPKYRGFAPLPTALINGEKIVGVTAFFAKDKYDTGDILLQKSISINYPIKIQQAINSISNLYSSIVLEIYEKILRNTLRAIPQDHKNATYSIWLDDEDYFIDWRWDAEKIKRFVDAVGFPYDGAKTKINDKILRINDVEVVNDVKIINRERHIGKIFSIENRDPIVICGKGLLKLINFEDLNGKKPKINLKTRLK